MSAAGWTFSIDRGGTFTDIVARAPDGRQLVRKLLSDNPDHSADAPVEGIGRILAECEAKRRIVERAEAAAVCTQHGRVRDSGCGECIAAEAVEVADGYVLADLAVAYADHPDYSEEWKP